MPSSTTRKAKTAYKTHSTVWSQITAIAARQSGCRYRSVSVPAPGQGQSACLCDADTAKRMVREHYVATPLPSEPKPGEGDWAFDPPKSCLLDELGK